MRKLVIACAVALLTSLSVGSAAQAAEGLTVQLVQRHDWHHHDWHHHDRRWHRYWHHGRYRHWHHRRCFVRRYVTYRYGERVVHVNRYCR